MRAVRGRSFQPVSNSLVMSQRSGRFRFAILLVTIAVSAAVFWRTAYPTITWWDSSSYSLVAATLGITSAPGSLLLTMLGWPLTHIPLGAAPAYVLNLFAGLLASVAVALVYAAALRVFRNSGYDTGGIGAAIGAALGALTFAFTTTLWEHATKFTPYVLTAVFTGLILLALLRWWENAEQPNAWRWLALLTFLFGLDFSVHRTNALLIPGAIAWMLVRRPRTFLHARSWLAAVGGMALGLSLHLVVIPIAATTQSPLNMFEPRNWSRFWDYVSLAQSGGGFLVDLWPRNSAFWSVQVMDFLKVLRDNFFHTATRVGSIGTLPAFVALAGLFVLWRANRRLALAFTLLLFLHAASTILYFNIPADYFRPFDRHYLPVFVTLGVMLAVGLGAVMQEFVRLATVRQRVSVAIASAAFVLVPTAQLIGNWSARDASRRHFTRDYAINALSALPPNAIYFTVGDNDSFPVWYVQTVEGVRPDVRIVNLSMANASWYVDQLVRRNPSFPLARDVDGLRLTSTVIDSSLVIPVRATAQQLALPADTSVPATITVRPRPSFGGREFIPADSVLVDIIRTNAWHVPITFAITGGDGAMSWLAPYGRLEGLHWRVVPIAGLGPDRDALRSNLLMRYEYRGYADPSMAIDDTSRIMGLQYFTAFTSLLDAEKAAGAEERCREAAQRLLSALPPHRLVVPGNDRAAIEARCGS